jgi:hypothetical protein
MCQPAMRHLQGDENGTRERLKKLYFQLSLENSNLSNLKLQHHEIKILIGLKMDGGAAHDFCTKLRLCD